MNFTRTNELFNANFQYFRNVVVSDVVVVSVTVAVVVVSDVVVAAVDVAVVNEKGIHNVIFFQANQFNYQACLLLFKVYYPPCKDWIIFLT